MITNMTFNSLTTEDLVKVINAHALSSLPGVVAVAACTHRAVTCVILDVENKAQLRSELSKAVDAIGTLSAVGTNGRAYRLKPKVTYQAPTPDQRLAREEYTKAARARVHKEMLKPNTFLLYVKKLPADVREEAEVVGLFTDALRRGEEDLQLEVVAAVVPLLPWGESKGFANVAVRANDEAAVAEAVRRLNEHDPEGAGRCLEANIQYWPPTPDQRLAREEYTKAARARVHKEMLKPNTFLLYVKKLPAGVTEEAEVVGLFTDALRRGGRSSSWKWWRRTSRCSRGERAKALPMWQCVPTTRPRWRRRCGA